MPDSSDRTLTGVFGLDPLIEGGFPKRRTMLVAGATGTGKSIFSMQYLYRGLTEYEEPGVYVTFDEPPENLRSDMLRFGWNLEELEKNELFAIVDGTSARAGAASQEEHAFSVGQLDFNKVLVEILSISRKIGAKRLVIDSIPALGFQLEQERDIRRTILRLSYVLSKSGLTSIITTEVPEQNYSTGSLQFSRYGIEEYIADGVILLGLLGFGSQATRTCYIRKMRGTRHSLETHPMEITEKGIEIRKIDALK